MKLRKISGILSMVAVLFMLSVPVMAQETTNTIIGSTIEVDNSSSSGESVLVPVESEDSGSITVYLEDTNKQLLKGNVKLAVTKVADVVDGAFLLKENFESAGVDLNDIQNANELEFAAKKLVQTIKSPDTYMVTNDAGIAKVSELPVGVYLIYAEDIADYENITPFLVSLPTFHESEGVMEFDIEVYPKHTPLEENGKPETPQTGIDNHAAEYAIISIISLVMSVIFFWIYFHKKNQVSR